MPLRTLLFLLVACEPKGDEFSGGGNGGGDDDSAGEADADTDSDSDTDAVPTDFDYDQLTDVIPYNSPTTVLATNATYQSLDVVDMVTHMTMQRIALGDTPQRVRWDSASNVAYVVYAPSDEVSGSPCKSDKDCDNRLSIVDMAKGSVETITLTVGKARYVATDVTLGRNGGVFVLGDGDDWWSQESVVEVDAKRALTVWPLQEQYEVNGVPLWYDGTSIFAEQWRFTFGTDPKKKTPLLVEANNYAPDDYDDWNGTPKHTALASDGSGILFPGGYNGETQTVVELDPSKDVVLHEYALMKGISPTDMAYARDEAHVITVGLDYDEYQLQAFDRATGKAVDSNNLGGIGTIASETEILVVASDDSYAWLYVFDSFTDPKHGKFLVARLAI